MQLKRLRPPAPAADHQLVLDLEAKLFWREVTLAADYQICTQRATRGEIWPALRTAEDPRGGARAGAIEVGAKGIGGGRGRGRDSAGEGAPRPLPNYRTHPQGPDR